MTRSVRAGLLVLAVVAALATGGCGDGSTAAPASTGTVDSGSATTADPLAGVERKLDTIEGQVDRDGTG